MAVLNIHIRRFPGSVTEAGALLDSLAGEDDRLWPGDRWPPMRFDRPLGVGAVGGHGPVRYTVEEYEPGRRIRFAFNESRGLEGFHEFSVRPDGNTMVELRHLLVLRLRGRARLSWPLAIRWMHDACVEDAFDRAEQAVTGSVRRPVRWSPVVRALRAAA
ncbi:SRPBCC family protein [Nocardia blacklockiae]|uniref:SRPBCC family protein n=1 Tax=Nocardia blacklockiae TaxID=480036 RepID=UPI0018937F38|nr:SRPBCC family protein [Nocardia blacklockiae]MBF6173688.1 SRPBCC family protein [Nocardia blacklockiae]